MHYKRMQSNMHYWSQWLNGVRRPFEDNHSERSIQRHKVRQKRKRKASDEPGERPNKIIMTEIAKQDTADLLPGDVKSGRQAIYTVD